VQQEASFQVISVVNYRKIKSVFVGSVEGLLVT